MSKLNPEMLARSGTEFGEQCALFCWCALPETRDRYPDAIKLYSTHQNFTDAVKGARAKQAGIRAGVADIFLPVAMGGFHGLYLELKIDYLHPVNLAKKRRGVISQAQKDFAGQVEADGFKWVCCDGWQGAVMAIEIYLSFPKI